MTPPPSACPRSAQPDVCTDEFFFKKKGLPSKMCRTVCFSDTYSSCFSKLFHLIQSKQHNTNALCYQKKKRRGGGGALLTGMYNNNTNGAAQLRLMDGNKWPEIWKWILSIVSDWTWSPTRVLPLQRSLSVPTGSGAGVLLMPLSLVKSSSTLRTLWSTGALLPLRTPNKPGGWLEVH